MIINGDGLSSVTIALLLEEGHILSFTNGETLSLDSVVDHHFIKPQKTLGESRKGDPVEIKTKDEPLKSYTVVLNSPDYSQNISHVSHVECSIKARSFDEALHLAKDLKFETHLEITSFNLDR